MRAGKRQAKGREAPRARLGAQTDREPIERRTDEPADTRDPHLVIEHELLAENMPSILKRLRRMDINSNGLLRYFRTKRR
jgi:hypothetical protein